METPENPNRRPESVSTMTPERMVYIALHTKSIDNLNAIYYELLRRGGQQSDTAKDPAIESAFTVVKDLRDSMNSVLHSVER